jgi:pyridoxamine 5'-phosphate oxidase
MDKSFVENLRKVYSLNELLESNVTENPINQFEFWFKQAVESQIKEPNAMILSTIKNNRPRARVVLLKGFDDNGFCFYTNYDSQKGQDINTNEHASLTFFWDILERQVRINGKVEKLKGIDSDKYFWSRPRESQIGAWVSEQSKVIANREVLDNNLAFFEEKFKDQTLIPRPENWGGFILKPTDIEFWQGRPSRLHDRLLYTYTNDNWKIDRLSP